MVIKKYLADTERNAIVMAQDDLGSDAIVMNIKKIQPKGLFRVFMKTKVEVTVAVDENAQNTSQPSEKKLVTDMKKTDARQDSSLKPNNNTLDALEMAMKSGVLGNDEKKTKKKAENNVYASTYKGSSVKPEDDVNILEKKIDNIQDSLQNLIDKKISAKINESLTESGKAAGTKELDEEERIESLKLSKVEACKQLIYDQLVEADIADEYVKELLEEVKDILNPDATINSILAVVYQKIILKLGQPKLISHSNSDKTKYAFFIGPTGVGKTTTIAKIVSDLKLNKKARVAMITADTYRIAAVDQLKTYANILGIPLKVVYSAEEMQEAIEEFSIYDCVLVDTAGRSHLSSEQQDDIKRLLDSVDDKEVYLTLSVTTKYKDLVSIAEMYKKITDYNLIFTKLDESMSIGCIYNIKRKTGASLSYLTYGQNVPDDFEQLDSQFIAKKLLGGNINGPS